MTSSQPPPADQPAAAQTAAGQDIYLRNMTALWRFDSQLAIWIDAVDDENRLPTEPGRTGQPTARITPREGRSLYLHSRYDPAGEGRKIADAIPIKDKFCFVIHGFGLGYHVLALHRRLKGDVLIVCIEPSLPTLAAAMASCDLVDLIQSGRLVILVNEDKARLHRLLRPRNTLVMLGTQLTRHAPSMQWEGEACARIYRLFSEFVTFTRMSLMTLVGNAMITCKNIAMNLPTYVTSSRVSMLRERFTGHPAVIVSAGPSLRRNIDQLADLKGRAVLCAVQTTLRPLLQRGITPDFVTSLDYHEMSKKFFDNVGDLRDVHLVAEPKATWHVLDHYPGPMSLLGSEWAQLLLGEQLAGKSEMKAGATVAHLAFYLAVYMGCDPIIFVGQDLAFSGHVFYVPGVEIHHTWRSELNRFCTMEMKEWDRIARNGEILRTVRGVDGGDMYTDELLLTYLEQFEKDIGGVPNTVINATEGGAHIRGTTVMPLREAVEKYCQRPIDAQLFAYRERARGRDFRQLSPAARELRQRLSEINEVVALCDEMLTLLRDLQGLTGDPAKFNRKLIRVDELRVKVQQSTRVYRIINQATQRAELRRFTADRRMSMFDADDSAEVARRQLERDIDFVSGIREGGLDVKPIIEESLSRMAALAETEQDA